MGVATVFKAFVQPQVLLGRLANAIRYQTVYLGPFRLRIAAIKLLRDRAKANPVTPIRLPDGEEG